MCAHVCVDLFFFKHFFCTNIHVFKAVNQNLPQKMFMENILYSGLSVLTLDTYPSTLSSTNMKKSEPQHTYHAALHTHTLGLCVFAIYHSPLLSPPLRSPPSCQPTPDVRGQSEPSHIQSVSHFLPRVKVKHHLCVCLHAFQ